MVDYGLKGILYFIWYAIPVFIFDGYELGVDGMIGLFLWIYLSFQAVPAIYNFFMRR